MDAIDDIDLSVPGVPSLVLRDLSEYATLPFIAAFDVPHASEAAPASGTSKQTRPQKSVTYVGLAKKTMPHLVDLYLRFKNDADVYNDGTLEALFSVRVIGVQMSPRCSALFSHRHTRYPSS